MEMGQDRDGLASALLHTVLLLRTSWPMQGIWYMCLNTDLALSGRNQCAPLLEPKILRMLHSLLELKEYSVALASS